MEDNSLVKIFRGLFKDSDEKDQPEGTVRFALNAVKESDNGEYSTYSTEESLQELDVLPLGYILLGKCYISNNKIALLSVSGDNSVSEIGIFDANTDTYTTHVNDATSPLKNKLKFDVVNQIDVIYRLRGGCKDTIYWTDDKNPPRYYDFSSPESFKDQLGNWVAGKFNLQKVYDKIPEFTNVTVEESGGNILPGSYNISIQLVDESLNPTEYIRTSPTVKIYNDALSKPYAEISGSINSEEEHLQFLNTNKAIKIELGNLDQNYMYYRLAIVCANSGTGQINEILKTELIPTSKNFFIFTGDNVVEKGTEEELLMFTSLIGKAKHIEQIENRLVLANVEGRQANLCGLQRYASKIKVDCVTKEVILNDIADRKNSKNPVHEFNNGIGYMPGEVYSVGIVYIFEDNSLSPVYHIPGKREEHANTVFSPDDSTYPMSANNSSTNNIYTENETCTGISVWGLDYGGQPLLGKPVRHHRFPLRSEIGLPLISTTYGENQTNNFYKLQLKLEGLLKTPVPCPEDTPDCGTDFVPSFEVRVTYVNEGESYSFTLFVDPNTFADGVEDTYDIEVYANSQYHSSSVFTDIVIEVTDPLGEYIPADNIDWAPYIDPDPSLSTTVIEESSTVTDKTVKSKILGFKFTDIQKPTIEDTGGLEVIGYMIVRNERTEFEKTILDSAVMLPNLKNGKYVSHGLVFPQGGTRSEDTFSLIHPEHKFHQKEYTNYDELVCQGYFDRRTYLFSKVGYDDVQAGTSYVEKKMHKENDDAYEPDGSPTSKGLDGWSLNLIARDNILDFTPLSSSYLPFTLYSTQFKERFYLDSLESRGLNGGAVDAYNISVDNKISMAQLNHTFNFKGLPYVVMRKNISDPYANFRLLPYFDEMLNPKYFDETGVSSVSVFNGDSYVTPMRYHSAVFWENRIAKRKVKIPVWKFVVGALVAVIGIVGSIFTGGAAGVGAGVALAALFGTGIAIAGVGAMLISSGIKQANFNKAYMEEYDKGLRNTALDTFSTIFYNYTPAIPFGFMGSGGFGQDGPSDDTICWISDVLTDVWFESAININLRNRFSNTDNPTFLHSPWKVETGNIFPIQTVKIKNLKYTDSNGVRYPISTLERHATQKLLGFDSTRDDNKSYLGVSLGEYYNINPDYERRSKQKIYTHLPLEYNCCSKCQEKFPHRVHYSEQSFQEELSDNYRVFLPNNYRDIEGHTGTITNVFKVSNSLYIHTEEALWQLPSQYQERVTDELISFIGTGAFFSIPPRQIIDDSTGNSAGTRHKWGFVKTPLGVFFPSEHQNAIYKFDGQLKPISNIGYKSWFKDEMKIVTDNLAYQQNGKPYEFRDNPSNPFGTGFVSVYDSKKERVLFTKRDQPLNLSSYEDYLLCVNNGDLTVFPNLTTIIEDEAQEGWEFMEVEDCTAKFRRDILRPIKIPGFEFTNEKLREKTNVLIHLDISDNWSPAAVSSVKNTVTEWFSIYKSSTPGYAGNLYFFTIPDCKSQRWLRILNYIEENSGEFTLVNTDPFSPGYGGETLVSSGELGTDFMTISFVNEAGVSYCPGGEYHEKGMSIMTSPPLGEYAEDFEDFISRYDSMISEGYRLNFLMYPVVFADDINRTYLYYGMIQHVVAAIEGSGYNDPDLSSYLNLVVNPYIDPMEYGYFLASLANPNPYPVAPDGRSLKDMGWRYIHNRGFEGTLSALNPIVSLAQFNTDLSDFLYNDTYGGEWEEVFEESYEIITEYKEIEGKGIKDVEKIDNSWTISYDLFEDFWISLHSFMPNMYFSTPEKFFSWSSPSADIPGNSIYEHNIKGSYNRYYNGAIKPFIVEVIHADSPVATKVFDSCTFTTDAWRYSPVYREFLQEKFITFNRAIFYNSRQTTGEVDLIVKDTSNNPEDYLYEQVKDLPATAMMIDKNELDWSVNQLRNLRGDYTIPMFSKNYVDRQLDYYIDKVVNLYCLDLNKEWFEQESLRDKYLAVRLIFDNFEDVKLVFNYQYESDVLSKR